MQDVGGRDSFWRRSNAGAVGLALACVLAPAAAIVWIVNTAAIRTDQVAAEHEARLLANGFELRKAEIRRTVMTETVWDEAVRNLDLRFDRDWAKANMVAFFEETSGYELVVVLDARSEPLLLHFKDGAPEATWSAIRPEVRGLVSAIRAREANLRRGASSTEHPVLVSDPVDETTIVRLNNTPFILTAALVQPDFGAVQPSRPAPIVVVGEALDPAFLDAFGAAYLLRDLRLAAHGDAAGSEPSLAIRNRGGQVVAQLVWSPDRPARDLIEHLAPPLSALALALFLIPLGLVIWERRRAAQLQLARDAAEAASVAKSRFLANMSHEIRTPLNGVVGITGALSKTDLSAAQREMVELIDTSAKSLESLLNDILDLARVEAGALEINQEPFDLATSVQACAYLFQSAAQAKGLQLQTFIDPDVDGTYLGDGARLRQILCNLLSNAVKFTPTGEVKLTVGPRSGGQAGLRFRVHDTGIGFDDEVAARLFARFEQGDPSITRRFGGSGLGLAISRTLARAMGGDLTASSTPGRGAVFELHLPLLPTQLEEPGGDAAPLAVSLGGLRILLAEDHATNRRVVELIFQPAGVLLTCVEDGAAAVSAFHREAFDLVLMDMQMPVMDGLTAIREIRAWEARSSAGRTPIYVLSANAMPEHVAASTAAGADGHLPKPISVAALLDLAIDTAAESKRRDLPSSGR